MNENNSAAAGWYPHATDAASEMYWDGAQWRPDMVRPILVTTAVTTPAATTPAPGTDVKRPWFKKKRFIIPIGAFVLIGAIGSIAGGGDEDDAVAAKSSTSQDAADGQVTVPDTTGMTVDQARVSLEDAGFEVIIAGDDTGGALVITQSPKSGTVDKGATVTITGEIPTKTVDVPDLVGLTVDEAAAALITVNLEGVTEKGVKGDYVVIEQNVKAGKTVDEGTKVTYIADPPAPEMTLSQRNAVNKGQSYLDYSGFSRQGLIEQLEYEGYSTEDATFGADNAGADWNAEAAEKAQSYLDYSSFSRQGLYDQLEYEGFTSAQIEYALGEVGY